MPLGLLLLPGLLEPEVEELLPGVVELLLPGVVRLEEAPGLPMLLPLGLVPRPELPELIPDWEPLVPGEPTALLLPGDPKVPL